VVDGVSGGAHAAPGDADTTMTMRLTEVRHNVTLDDKMFKRPGKQ
jgi:hypothetical protein